MCICIYVYTPQFRKMSQHSFSYYIKNALTWCANAKMCDAAEEGKQQRYILVGIHCSGGRFSLL